MIALLILFGEGVTLSPKGFVPLRGDENDLKRFDI
jgi:hypothetical protein